jgi:hydroxymethylbilane synthase
MTEDLDAIVVAAAGLARMEMTDRATELLEPPVMLPAIGQGALGLEARRDDQRVLDMIGFLNHEETAVTVSAERAFLAGMEGGCQVPLAALGRLEGDRVVVSGLVADVEGRRYYQGQKEAPAGRAVEAGRALAEDLLAQGGRAVMDELYQQIDL